MFLFVNHTTGPDDVAGDVEQCSFSGCRVRFDENALVVSLARVEGVVGYRVNFWFEGSVPYLLRLGLLLLLGLQGPVWRTRGLVR